MQKKQDMIQQAINTAVKLHQANNFKDAASIYKEVLTIDPDNFDALHLFGVLSHQTGDNLNAIAMINKALQQDKTNPFALNNLGEAYRALHLLHEAEQCYRSAIILKNDYFEATNNLGNVLSQRGLKEKAAQAYRQAIAIHPDYAEAYNNLGNVLTSLELFNEAETAFRNALRLNPAYAEAHNNYGNFFLATGQSQKAEQSYRQAMALNPAYAAPYNNLGKLFLDQGMLKEGIEACHTAIALQPNFDEPYYNLGTTFQETGEYAAAEDAFNKALTLNPEYASCKWNLSLLMLLQGRFSDGFKLYENRFSGGDAKVFAKMNHLFELLHEYSRWQGESLQGKSLLVIAEQGLGDNLMMMRYLALIKRYEPRRIIVYCEPPLFRLFQCQPEVNEVVSMSDQLPFGTFDLYCPSMSLPYLFQTGLESIPNNIPYIAIPESLKRQCQAGCAKISDFKIGLAWAAKGKNKSIFLNLFSPLLEIPGIQLVNLQKGVESRQLKELGWNFIDWMDECQDLLDTAALISQLDLVISVDTSVVHLAGALGKPVWLLNRLESDWRWLLEREDSPWYPSMKIFTQRTGNDWTSVITMLKQELAQLLDVDDFYNNHGIELLQQGLIAEAEQAFLKGISIDPNNAELYCNLGVSLNDLNKYEDALESYRLAIALRPNYMQAFFNMGNSCQALGNLQAAASCYEQTLTVSPNFLPALRRLGEVYKTQEKYAHAAECFTTATRIDPLSVPAYQGLGVSLAEQEDYTAAIIVYKQALKVDPTSASTYNMIGLAHLYSGQFSDAETCFRKAFALAPDNPARLSNLGTALHCQGRTAESIAVCRQLLALDPTCAEGRWNLSLVLLARGEFQEGWQEYEWRFNKTNPVLTRNFSQPVWDGSSLNGKTILLHAEQGFGDTIQFTRYVPLVVQQAGQVIIECQSVALKRILSSLAGVEVFVFGDPLPYFDCHLPLLSLPLLFKTTLETIPAMTPYLYPDQGDVGAWRLRLGKSKIFRIGISWFGRQNLALNRKRSCPLKMFATLFSIPHTEFYSLQVGEGVEQISQGIKNQTIIDFTADIHDFADTAALIMNLDLVITIDTAVAHLAGALGVPTWVLLPFSSDWRWLEKRNDSPWYPTMRLFRQPSLGDWQTVIHKVREELIHITKG